MTVKGQILFRKGELIYIYIYIYNFLFNKRNLLQRNNRGCMLLFLRICRSNRCLKISFNWMFASCLPDKYLLCRKIERFLAASVDQRVDNI